MQLETLDRIAQRYRDEGYGVIVRPNGDQIPPFVAGFQPDLIAVRGHEGVIVEIKLTRSGLAKDSQMIEKASQDALEPSDEQLAEILEAAEQMAEKGYTPYAYVVAWGGLEAAMRRVRDEAELYGRTTPAELMRILYGNGFLNREQFERLREAYKIRTQVVHGLVPSRVDPALVGFVTATARYLAYNPADAVSAS
jgi:uncharacterized protein YutE (UPF0331/DUF86 family)